MTRIILYRPLDDEQGTDISHQTRRIVSRRNRSGGDATLSNNTSNAAKNGSDVTALADTLATLSEADRPAGPNFSRAPGNRQAVDIDWLSFKPTMVSLPSISG